MSKDTRTIDRLADVTARLVLARGQADTLRRCGLTNEADRVQRTINALVVEQAELERLNQQEQDNTKRILYQCFVACDLVTELADDFADAIQRTSWGELKRQDDAFTALLRQKAKEFNDVVVLVDEGGKGEKASMYYSDMAEQATAAAKQAIIETVNNYFNKPQATLL